MKEKLTPNGKIVFQRRFGDFHDAVLHRVCFFPCDSTTYTQKAEITIGVRDWHVEDEKHWVNVAFVIEGVTRMLLQRPKEFECSVISRLNIGFFNEEVHLDFFPGPSRKADDPKSYDDERTTMGSKLIVVGKTGYWSISPYKEHSPDTESSENGEE